MKKRFFIYSFSSLISLSLIFYIFIPSLLVAGINYYYHEFSIRKTEYISLTCIRLLDVNVKKENISGIINSAIVCSDHTIEIDRGELSLTINQSTKSEAAKVTTIIARDLDLDVVYRNAELSLKGVNIDQSMITIDDAFINHSKGDVKLTDIIIDRKNFDFSVYNGELLSDFEIYHHKIGHLSFYHIQKINNQFSVGTIMFLNRDNNALDNLFFSYQDNLLSDIIIDYVQIYHPKLYGDLFRIHDIKIDQFNYQKPLENKFNLQIGQSTFAVDLQQQKLSGNNTCENLFDTLPQELKNEQIRQMKLKGNFEFEIQLNPAKFKIKHTCINNGPLPFIQDLRKPFIYYAFHPDGSPFERTSGPNTSEWLSIDYISSNVITAVTLTEDPRFFSHRGVIPQALENSLKENLRLGKFFRGGSTITMQLAKNLWLFRDRTIGRKIQEGILTIGLEQYLSKDQILELYLNVIEFGPDIYGIGPACAKLLEKTPDQVSLSEALYLSLRLPAPNKETSYEYKKKSIKKLIDMGIESGRILPEEINAEEQMSLDEM